MNHLSSLLRLSLVNGITPEKFYHITAKCFETGRLVDELFSMSAEELKNRLEITDSLAEAIFSSRLTPRKCENILNRLRGKNIKIFSLSDPEYPGIIRNRLGCDAPPILYLYGNIELIKSAKLGLIGSRTPGKSAKDACRKTACLAAENKWTIVSGNAPGIDKTAQKTGIGHHAQAIICPPVCVENFIFPNYLSGVPPDRFLIIFEFPVRKIIHQPYPLLRDRLIAALSDTVVAFDVRLQSGTIYTVRIAARLDVPVFAQLPDTDDEDLKKGFGAVLKCGGMKVDMHAEDDFQKVVRAIKNPERFRPSMVLRQPDLFSQEY